MNKVIVFAGTTEGREICSFLKKYEIANIFWIVSEKVSPLFCICGDGEQSWRKAVVDLGEDYKSWLKYPRLPILN